MNLKRALRDLSFPLEEEPQAQQTESSKKKAKSRKYGRIQLLRKQRHKQKKPVQDSSWKQFKSSDGLKKLKSKANQSQVVKSTIPPRADLVDLGKTILRSRRKLMVSNPPSKKPAKPSSIFEKKDFKNLRKDLRTIFCS
ncbi:hypothetical protein ACTXT7_007236 [Hymenolepis weldensis]